MIICTQLGEVWLRLINEHTDIVCTHSDEFDCSYSRTRDYLASLYERLLVLLQKWRITEVSSMRLFLRGLYKKIK